MSNKQPKEEKHDGVCPNCGYCPQCGRGGAWFQPYQPWPYVPYTPYPWSPWIIWGTGTSNDYTSITITDGSEARTCS